MRGMAAPRMSSAMVDVLTLLLQAWEDETDVHGWLIMKSVRRSGPAVYAVLDRLEDAGWVTGVWEKLGPGEQRPRRRFYRLTGAGVEAARERRPVPATQVPGRLRPQPGFGLVALRLRRAR